MFNRTKKIADEQLIAMIKEGGRAMNKAIENILQLHGDKIKGYLLKLSESMEEAEDAFHEGLAAFIMNVRKGSFKGESAISSYLISICKNIWFKKFKRMMIHKKWEDAELNNPENNYEETVITKDLKNGLEFLMQNLKEKCKEVLNLWALSYSMTEIAEQLGYTNTQVVMNKKNLCLKELRQQLTDNPNLAQLVV